MTVYGSLHLPIPHADVWRGTGYTIEHSTDGPVVEIRLDGPGPVSVHLHSNSADDLVKLRAVISAAITALGYGEDLPPFDAVQRVVEKLNAKAEACAARADLQTGERGIGPAASWDGQHWGLTEAARIVARDLVGAALAQAVNEEPEPAAVTELLKCECHE